MSRQFIGLHFFDAIHVEANVSEETTGELSLYTHLPVTRVLGSCDCQKYRILNYQIFQITLVYLSSLPRPPTALMQRHFARFFEDRAFSGSFKV